jgi:5-methylcytosine-specific restriction protein A
MSVPPPPIPFVVGRQYTRADIFDALGIRPHPTGGNWFTGYNRHGDDWYVFAHIQAAGRTGHDYHNA